MLVYVNVRVYDACVAICVIFVDKTAGISNSNVFYRHILGYLLVSIFIVA